MMYDVDGLLLRETARIKDQISADRSGSSRSSRR